MSAQPDLRSLAALDALGALDGADRLELERALRAEPAEVRQEIENLYDVAALLPHALPFASPSATLRARLLAHAAGRASSSTENETALSEALHFIRRDEGWQPHPIPGITVKVLSVDDASGVATLLVKAAPGTTYPAHHHSGPEGCYVIEGEVLVAGRRIGPGDFHLADADSDHDPLYTATGATVLLVCAAADYL
jgi:hypothetical protein